ncbi:MAG: hypothetical protein E6I03_09365 [Chloroflexi bacterium]|nr:MAG: hypothetical protein E6I03_09365 [Chloroflexota bacterium]
MSDEVVTPADDLQYCPRCGAPLIVRLLPTEDRPRLVCDRGHILYVNPKLIVGVIPEPGCTRGRGRTGRGSSRSSFEARSRSPT